MVEMNEEKYISIEYETWKNKYLPLEQINESLSREVEELKKIEKVRVAIAISGQSYPQYYGESVGSYEIKTGKFDLQFEKTITQHIESEMRYQNIMSKSEANEYLKEVVRIEQQSHNHKRDAEKLIKEKIQTLPKIIRWLFKIKIK